MVEFFKNFIKKIERAKQNNLKEADTKSNLIEPFLEYLGWNVREYDEVEKEKRTRSGKDVDYALKIDKDCIIYIEAKRICENIDNVKHGSQIVEYAAVDGIEWAILTNGDKIKFYKIREGGEVNQKIIFEIIISKEYNLEYLEYFKKKNIRDSSILDQDLNNLILTNKVIKLLEDLFNDIPKDLIKYLETKLPEFKKDQIRNALENINIDYINLYLPKDIINKPEEIDSFQEKVSEKLMDEIISRERIIIKLPSPTKEGIKPTWKTYNLIPLPANHRFFFPGFKDHFILMTDIGEIETYIDGAPGGTIKGAPRGGHRIRVKMGRWFKFHADLRVGDLLIITKLDKNTYSLEIEKVN